jgi:hypothetical protein
MARSLYLEQHSTGVGNTGRQAWIQHTAIHTLRSTLEGILSGRSFGPSVRGALLIQLSQKEAEN